MVLPPRIPKSGLPPMPNKRKPEARPAHLRFLRNLECPIYRGARPIEIHHLMRADPKRGLGRRAADRYTIPLSQRAHRELHAAGDEEAWLASHGIDGRALAAALWRNTGDRTAALRLLWRAKTPRQSINT